MCTGFVEPIERLPKVRRQRRQARRPPRVAGFACLLRKRQASGLRGRNPCIQVAAHRPNAVCVRRRVETKAAG